MTLFKKAPSKRTTLKTQALRMLMTSGVIRSASTEPPSLVTERFSSRLVEAGHDTSSGHLHHGRVCAEWRSTVFDIVRDFSRT